MFSLTKEYPLLAYFPNPKAEITIQNDHSWLWTIFWFQTPIILTIEERRVQFKVTLFVNIPVVQKTSWPARGFTKEKNRKTHNRNTMNINEIYTLTACFAKVSLLTLEGLLRAYAKPLVFSNLVIVCIQCELISIAQTNASSTISFYVFCDRRKKYFTICDQILRHRFNKFKAYLI